MFKTLLSIGLLATIQSAKVISGTNVKNGKSVIYNILIDNDTFEYSEVSFDSEVMHVTKGKLHKRDIVITKEYEINKNIIQNLKASNKKIKFKRVITIDDLKKVSD